MSIVHNHIAFPRALLIHLTCWQASLPAAGYKGLLLTHTKPECNWRGLE